MGLGLSAICSTHFRGLIATVSPWGSLQMFLMGRLRHTSPGVNSSQSVME